MVLGISSVNERQVDSDMIIFASVNPEKFTLEHNLQ